MKQQQQSFTSALINMQASNNSNTPQEKLRKISFDQIQAPYLSSKEDFFNNNQWGIKGWSNRIYQKKFDPSQKVKTQKNVSNRKSSYRVSIKQMDRKGYIEKLQEKLLLLKQLKVKGQTDKKAETKQQILQKLPDIGLNPQKSLKNIQQNNLMNLPEYNYNFTTRKPSNMNKPLSSLKPLQFYTTLLRKNSSQFSQIARHSRSLSHTKDQISFINYPMMMQQKKNPKGLKKMVRLQDYIKYQTKKTPRKQEKQNDSKKLWSDF